MISQTLKLTYPADRAIFMDNLVGEMMVQGKIVIGIKLDSEAENPFELELKRGITYVLEFATPFDLHTFVEREIELFKPK